MHRHRMRLRLEVGVPMVLHDSFDPKKTWTLTLEDFSITPFNFTWIIKLDDGSLVEGRNNQMKSLPYWADGHILGALPINASRKPRGSYRVEFIVNMPTQVIPQHLLDKG